jgi:fucose permease
VPLICYVYVLYFSLWGYKPVETLSTLPIGAAAEK